MGRGPLHARRGGGGGGTWHDPVEVTILDLLVEVVLHHIKGAVWLLPAQEAHLARPLQPLQPACCVSCCLA